MPDATLPGSKHWDSLDHRPPPAFQTGDAAIHVLLGPVVIQAVLLDGDFPRYRVKRRDHHLQFHTSAPFLTLAETPQDAA